MFKYISSFVFQPKLGIIEEYGSSNNGIFSCSFTRQNFVDGEKDVFDLNKDWHMMFAVGPAVNGKIANDIITLGVNEAFKYQYK
jgi:hypothetical protein